MHRVVQAGAGVLVLVTGFFLGQVHAGEQAFSNKCSVENHADIAEKSVRSIPEIAGALCPDDSIEEIEKTASSKDEEIQRLEKLKEYYETNIRRLSRTAWRLEFKDPGYSRILDERVAQLQRKLDAVNKQLAEKGVKSS